jgi:hypothetical protein
MDDVATWSVWHVGEIGKLGTVQAPHYAAAIKVACEKWPHRVDWQKSQAGFSVRVKTD